MSAVTSRAAGTQSSGTPSAGEPAARPRARRSRGEQTRRKILDAVLTVIARDGVRGVTHRAVAAEAGVQLSLTTYYFRDIESMISEAFAQFSEQSSPEMASLWRDLFTLLDGLSAADLRRKRVREEVCVQLAERATEHLVSQVVDSPVGVAVEQAFTTQQHLSPELRQLGIAHRRQLLEPLVALCRRFNARDPEVDAELLLNTISALEYRALAMSPEQLDRDQLRRLLRRHIGWVLGLKRA